MSSPRGSGRHGSWWLRSGLLCCIIRSLRSCAVTVVIILIMSIILTHDSWKLKVTVLYWGRSSLNGTYSPTLKFCVCRGWQLCYSGVLRFIIIHRYTVTDFRSHYQALVSSSTCNQVHIQKLFPQKETISRHDFIESFNDVQKLLFCSGRC